MIEQILSAILSLVTLIHKRFIISWDITILNIKPDRDQFLPHVSIIKKWCRLNDRDACDLLLNLQKLDSQMEHKEQMEDLIGQ